MIKQNNRDINLTKIFAVFIAVFVGFLSLSRIVAGNQWDAYPFLVNNYWYFTAGLAILLALLFFVVTKRFQSGKGSYIISGILALDRYRFLIKQLTQRDFKTKYMRSILGVLWSFLNPLLMMLVQFVVFSTLFGKGSTISNFAAYLIIGNVCFTFFNESCSLTLNSIVGNAGLITKVYMPKYIYPLTRTVSSLVNLAIALIPMFAVCLITGVHFTWAALLTPYFLFCLFLFCLGMGMALSCIMVFFRDTQFLWGIIVTVWTYLTPIFYPIDIIPESIRGLFELNPMYIYISAVRSCIMYGTTPMPGTFMKAMAASLITLLLGFAVFKKGQDKFILYL